MRWQVELLSEAEAVLRLLPAGIRASFSRIAAMIETHGLDRMREPHVKHLDDRLLEMRLKGKDGIARAVYVTASGSRVVVVHVFRRRRRRPHAGRSRSPSSGQRI